MYSIKKSQLPTAVNRNWTKYNMIVEKRYDVSNFHKLDRYSTFCDTWCKHKSFFIFLEYYKIPIIARETNMNITKFKVNKWRQFRNLISVRKIYPFLLEITVA